MNIGTLVKSAVAAVAVGTAAAVTAPTAVAAYPIVGKLGSTLQETDTVGQVVFSWTVAALQPSSDTLPGYTPTGKIWQATAGVHAVHGPVTPAISQFNAVAPNQASYRVLWQVASPDGISGATIPDGASAAGKIYFDVTGAAPTTVTMNNGMEDLMIWTP